jgi:hypothetical protein
MFRFPASGIQIKGEYQAREPLLQRYLAKVKESLLGLSKFEIKHIPREENSRADLLSNLASTKSPSTLKLVVEVLPFPCAILQMPEKQSGWCKRHPSTP